ncbi:YadA-like family protein [Enterobacter kobei]|uniref:YadA-like family protein n=1 Tax=Enterobacter kobei TaxID=208224 RepID=UPI002026AC9F|nr:YadA-like family protein [Enterobacter kobei]
MPDNTIMIKHGDGDDAFAEGAASVAIGMGAVAKGETGGDWSSIAINGIAEGRATIAIGEEANAVGQRSTAIGNSSSVAGERSVALGADAVVNASDSVAIGNASITDRANTVSFGNSSQRRQLINLSAGTDTHDAIVVEQLTPILNALGGGASLDAMTGAIKGPLYMLNSIDVKTGSAVAPSAPFNTVEAALSNLSDGMKNLANATIRYDDAGVKGVITVGTTGNKTRLTNLADALVTDTSTDAVTGGQLHAVKYDILANQNNISSNKSDITLNKANIASNGALISINTANIATNTAGVIKNGANLRGVAASLGGGAQVNATGDFVGPSFSVQGQTAGNVGDAMALLDTGVSSLSSSLTNIVNNLNDGTAGLVQQDATSRAITVAQASDGTSMSIAGTEGARALSGVKAGLLSADSSEAVNGGQLFSTNERVGVNEADIASNRKAIATNSLNIATNTAGVIKNGANLRGVAASLGGGAQVNATGDFVGPSFSVQGQTAGNVGDAMALLDTGVSSLSSSLTNIVNNLNDGSTGLVQQDATSRAITVAQASDGTSMSIAGTEGARALSGVKAGLLSADSSEAVNGGQLFSTNERVGVNEADIASNRKAIATNSLNIATNTAGVIKNGANLRGVAASLGGGAQVNATGDFVGPSFSVQGKTAGNVGDAMALLDTGVSSLTSSLTNIVNNLNDGSTGLVQQDAASRAITVAQASDGTSMSIAGTEGARALSGVKAGLLSADSSEAVNGGQLFSTNERVGVNEADIASNRKAIATNSLNIATNTAGVIKNGANLRGVAASLGGGAQVNATGDFVGPSFSVQGQTAGNVGDAMALLDTGVSSLSSSLTNIVNNLNDGSTGLVQQDATSRAITVAQASDGTSMSIAGTEGARALSGVKAGLLSADSSEAVNGGQLFSTNERVGVNEADIASNRKAIATNSLNIATNTAGVIKNGANLRGVAASLGGGAQVNATGDFVGPSFSVQGKTAGNVGDAMALLDTGVSSLTSSLTNIVNNLNDGSTGLVQQDAASRAITVAQASDGTSMSIAGTEGARALSGVKAGLLSADSSEAVNGGQLFSTNERVGVNEADIASNRKAIATNSLNIATNTAGVIKNGANLRGVAASLGGGAQVNATGDFVGPSFSVQGQTAGNVGDAMALLDTGVSSLSSSLTNIVNNLNDGTAGLVQQDATSRAITVAQASNGTSMSIAGTEGARSLSGVKAGMLTVDSTEAVNGGQLFSTNERVTKNTNDIALNTSNIATLNSMFNDLNYNISTGNVGIVKQDQHTKTISIGGTSGGGYVSIAGSEGNRVLSGVNTGRVSADSADAVNGSQLFELSNQVNKNSSDLNVLMDEVVELTSGGAGLVKIDGVTNDISIGAEKGGDRVSVNGTAGDRIISGVADGIANNDVATVGQLKEITQSATSSFLSVNNATTRNKPQATGSDAIALGANASAGKANSMAMGINAQATAENSVALGNNAIADRDNSVSVGSEGAERQITNVAKGTKDTDAVNLGQLNEISSSINNIGTNVNREFSRLSQKIDKVEHKLSAGVASAMAMSAMPQPYSAGSGMMALGGGTYNGQSAIAIGASKISENGKWITKINGSANTKNDVGISVGVGYQW